MKSLAAAALCVMAGTAAAQKTPDEGMDKSQQKNEDMPKQGEAEAQPTALMAKKMTASATVDKIDKKDREVTLRDADGVKFKVTVPDDVKKFDAIKKGDKVTLDYYSSVALSLQKSDAKPTADSEMMMARTPGELPGGVVAQKVDETVTIEKVDKKDNKVTVKLPDGESDTIHVTDTDLQARLDKLKKGDKIRATYTEGVAISIDRAQKKNKG